MEEHEKKATVLSPIGRLDSMTVFDFEPKVTEVIETGTRYLVLDLSRLTYLSSAGLRLILRTVQKLRAAGGSLTLAAPTDQVLQILSIAGFHNLISICRTVAEAEVQCLQQTVKPRAARFAPEIGLNLPESFYLLAFDGKEGRLKPLPQSDIVRVPAACAVIELALLERLDWDLNALRVVDRKPTNDPLLDRALDLVSEGSPDQSIESCLRRLFREASALEQELVRGLVAKCILSYRDAKVAGLFPVKRLAINDPRPLTVLRDDLRAVLIGKQVPDIKEAILVGLLNTCGLFPGILSVEEIDSSRSRISQLGQLDLVGQTLSRLITEIRRLTMFRSMA